MDKQLRYRVFYRLLILFIKHFKMLKGWSEVLMSQYNFVLKKTFMKREKERINYILEILKCKRSSKLIIVQHEMWSKQNTQHGFISTLWAIS